MDDRFKDTGLSIYDLGNIFLVRCPRCDSCAKVVSLNDEYPYPKRVICEGCGYTKDREGTTAIIGHEKDWYFGLPLWLQIHCHRHTLWAYNTTHLDLLEAFVKADLRETYPNNSTLASRLPTWLKHAKNREDILRCIAKLRQRADHQV